MKKLFKVLLLSLLIALSVVGFTACKQKDDGGTGNNGGGNPTEQITPPIYENESRNDKYNVYNGITVDGKISQGEWDNFNTLIFDDMKLGGVSHHIEWSCTFSEEGVICYTKVIGSPAYYNPERDITSNSGVELFIAPSSETNLEDGLTWEIELFPNGEFGSHLWTAYGDIKGAYRPANCDIDLVGSVDGELNKPDNNGYVLEWMIPWVYFDLDSAPAYLNADIAIMYCPSYTGSREAWVSVRKTYGDSYSWTNPKDWYGLTKDGIFDDNGAMIYTINDGNGVEGGSVAVTGSYKTGSTVTVTPDNGYQIKSLYVNGVKANSLVYSVPALYDRHLDIQVEFKQATGNPFTFNVKTGYAYTDKKPVGKDVSVTLVGANDDIYAGTTDANGQVTISAPDGTYNAIMPNYTGGKITLTYQTGGENTYDLVFNKSVLDTTGTGAVLTDNNSANGATLTGIPSTTTRSLSGFNGAGLDFDGKVVLDYVYGVDGTSITCTFIRWQSLGGSFYNNQVAWQGNKIIIKNNETTVKNVIGTGIIEVNIVYVVDGSTVKCYLKTNDGYEFLFKNDAPGKVTGFGFESVENEGTYYYKNIKVYDGEYAENFEQAVLSSSNVENATVTFSKDKVSLGEDVVVTITPDNFETTVITSIKVNGTPVDFNITDGIATYTFTHNGGIDSYVITVDTKTVNAEAIEFTLKHKFGYTNAVSMPNGVKIDFVNGGEVFSSVVNNGAISIRIPDGTYSIKLVGYAPVTVVIEDGFANTTDLTLLRTVVSHYGSYGSLIDDGTTTANGGAIDFGTDTSISFVKEYFYFAESVDWSKKTVLEYDFTLSNNAKIFSGIFFRTCDKSNITDLGTYYNQGTWAGSNIYIRPLDDRSIQTTITSENGFTTTNDVTLKAVVVVNGTTIEFYLKNSQGQLNKIYTHTASASINHVMTKIDDHESGYCKWSNVKVYDGADATAKLNEFGIN